VGCAAFLACFVPTQGFNQPPASDQSAPISWKNLSKSTLCPWPIFQISIPILILRVPSSPWGSSSFGGQLCLVVDHPSPAKSIRFSITGFAVGPFGIGLAVQPCSMCLVRPKSCFSCGKVSGSNGVGSPVAGSLFLTLWVLVFGLGLNSSYFRELALQCVVARSMARGGRIHNLKLHVISFLAGAKIVSLRIHVNGPRARSL